MLFSALDPTRQSIPATVENIADAVTHARFVGTDQSSDGVVLMKILQVYAYNSYMLHDLKFLQHCCWRLQSSGTSYHFGWLFVTDILNELAAHVFRVVQEA
jgi:hypothetical protein